MPSFKTFTYKAQRRIRDRLVPKTDWTKLLASERDVWNKALSSRDPHRSVLIATSTGGHETVTAIESLLAIALTLRGAAVHFLLCDGLLPACQIPTLPDLMDTRGNISEDKRKKICRNCISKGRDLYDPLGLPVHTYGEWVNQDEREFARQKAQTLTIQEILDHGEGGVHAGEQAVAGALRFFAAGDLKDQPHADLVLRRYFEAALLTEKALSNLFKKNSFAVAAFHHGLYIPQGTIGDVARARKMRIVNWNVAYKRRCLIFSHEDTYHHTLMKEPASSWEHLELSSALDRRLTDYLKKREEGTEDWISFHVPSSSDPDGAKDTNSFKRPYVLLLTNVLWDAQLHYPANAFTNMMEWLIETITYFGSRPDLDLVIRVHPAERTGIPRSRQTVSEEIKKHFKDLPQNIHVIGPEEAVSTYRLADSADAALIYGTKTGVELSARGIPVIAAGEAWIRNKGISYDVSSKKDYKTVLDKLPFGKKLDPEVRDRARRYAFHFFFRRMIPLKNLTERPGLWPPLRAEVVSLRDLLPGRDPSLDIICDGILNGTEFVYPAERISA